MTKSITKFLLFFCFLFFSFFSKAQVTAPDEDGTPYTTCNTDGANATRTSNDLANPVNVGTIDDRSCYANYKETTISGTTWGIYNITDGSNNQDAANTLQPRIERSLSRSQETGIGSYAKFTGTVRILEVGDASGTNNDGTYIMQAKGKHTGGGGSADPAICLFLAKPVLDTNGNQVSFNIYREQINVRGGEGSTGRTLVYLTNIAKNVATSIELKVGFRQDPSDNTKKIHYADAVIGTQTFNFNIPDPERGLESGIRYGVYRVKGGRAQIRWANTTYQKEEVVDNGSTGNNSQSWEFKTSQNANGWVAGSTTLGAAIVTDGLEITWNANTKPKVRIPSGANINTTTNKILALTLINNSTEPIDWQVKYTRADNGSDKFFGNTNFDDTPASVTTSKTYYYDMTDAAWNGTVNEFEIQMRDTGSTNRDNASSAGSIIFQQIAFINEIPAPTITSVAAGDWTSTSIWDGGVVPTSTDNVVVNHAVRIKNGVTAAMASLSIGNSPGQLRVDNGSVVTVTGSVSITRSQDGMAFYAQSGPLGSFTYGSVDTESTGKRVFVRPRLPKNDAWSLISSPVANSRINEITHNNSAYIVTKGGKLSIASYNDGNASGSKYVYYSSASEPADNVYIGEGQGHLLKVDNSGDTTKPDYYQRGVLRTTFPINITISDAGNGFNLLGNPLMGFLNVNDAADATNNILRVNGSNGTSGGVLAEDTVWLWDSVNEVWITKNLGSTSYKMPGVQGFFVKAKSGGGTFSFTKAMQSTTGDTYLKTNNSKRFEVNLSVANKGFKRSTSIVFTDNVTTSFDNGYDSSTFGAYASNFEIYTGLVADNTAKKLAIQSLPNKNFENLVVPVGVKVSEETAYTFNLDVTNLPKGYKVFLEDRLTNTFARLDEAGSEYTVTLSGETDGRFFIHTKSSVLSAESQTLSGVGVYKDASTLNVVGLSQGKATLSLFNMLGKEVYVHFFVSKSVNNIHLPSLAKGIYIVKLNTERGSLSKKIILD